MAEIILAVLLITLGGGAAFLCLISLFGNAMGSVTNPYAVDHKPTAIFFVIAVVLVGLGGFVIIS